MGKKGPKGNQFRGCLVQRNCLKCGHVKHNASNDEVEACPNCGAIYSRVEALAAAGQVFRQIKSPEQLAAERAAAEAAEKAAAEAQEALIAQAWKTGDWSALRPDLVAWVQSQVILSTTPSIPGREVSRVVDVISAECAFGMNVFKDIGAALIDITGGRSGAVQSSLRDARKVVLDGLRKEAMALGAQAVIGVDLDYSEISGGGKSMLFVVATGTAVKLI